MRGGSSSALFDVKEAAKPQNFGIARQNGRSTFTLQMKKPFFAVALSSRFAQPAGAAVDTAKIDEIAGLKGKLSEKESVYKVSFRAAT
jgi:hypothetical protein